MTYPSDFTDLSELAFSHCDLNSALEEVCIFQANNMREKVVHNNGECNGNTVLCVPQIEDFVRRIHVVRSSYCAS